MHYFPITMKLAGRRVAVVGGGEDAIAKLRLLLKSEAQISVFSETADRQIKHWHQDGKITWVRRDVVEADTDNLALAYISGAHASDNETVRRDGAIEVMERHNIPYCVIDDIEKSTFITPAIIDRDPVTVAISTEGTAPVLARRVKAMVEEKLPPNTGVLARLAGGFRRRLNGLSSAGRRLFWERFFDEVAPSEVAANHGETFELRINQAMENLLAQSRDVRQDDNPVQFISAGPGDPDLLTIKARRALDQADVVIHDRLISTDILELVRREATVIEAGKIGYGRHTPQGEINALLISHALNGKRVARLKSGDAGIYGRLDEEIAALHDAGISFTVIPGVTTALAAAAAMGVSLTSRGRNSEVRFLTARDVKGFADYQWHDLAKPDAVAAIYMGLKALGFLQGRLMMHGAAPSTPITIASNITHADGHWLATCLGDMVETADAQAITAPVIVMLGLHPHQAKAALLASEPPPFAFDRPDLKERIVA